MDKGVEIIFCKDIDAKEFKENFFYHFDKKETASIAAALIAGGGIYFIGINMEIKLEMVSLLMAAASVLPLLIGFFEKQRTGFIDYMRKKMFLHLCSDLVWESTEDFGKVETCRKRRKMDGNIKEI